MSAGPSIPIAIKFAVAIVVLVLLVVSWQTRTAVRVAEESQEEAINESGIKDVNALSSLLDPAWIADEKLRDRLDAALKRFCAATRGEGVLNAMVYPPGGGMPLATGKTGETSFQISRDNRSIAFAPAAASGVEIHELEYDGQPVRRFSRTIFAPATPPANPPAVTSPAGDPPAADPAGGAGASPGERPLGRVEVFLSALRISESREETWQKMFAISAVALAVAAVLSFLLAAYLTSPIRALARDLRQVSLGNLDHQSPVRSGDEIGDLARTFNQMTGNLRAAQEARIAQRALEHELNLATQIQSRLLPAEVPRLPGLDLATYYRPAREVGGDYYDFIPLSGDRLGMAVADVSGKGVPASLVMTMTRSLLRMASAGAASPTEALAEVNRILAGDVTPGMFVTLVYLVLHLRQRRIELVRAGHNAPLLYQARSRKIVTLQPHGIALGLDRGGALFAKELERRELQLQPGDILAVYTDGIVEAKDAQGECYSDARFARTIAGAARGSAEEIIAAVLADLDAHRGEAEQSDDITLLVVKAV